MSTRRQFVITTILSTTALIANLFLFFCAVHK